MKPASSSARTRRRQGGAEMPGAVGQLDIGHPPVGLKIAQDPSIDLVELDASHRSFSSG